MGDHRRTPKEEPGCKRRESQAPNRIRRKSRVEEAPVKERNHQQIIIMATKSIKLVVVGDGAVGKTCLLISYANNRFPEEYVPTVFDNYVVNLTAGEETIELGLWDTAGQEEYDLRNDNSTLEKLKGQGQRPVTHEEGEELARKLKAVKFIECSAFTGENLKTVFDDAVKSVLFSKRKKAKGGCSLF